MEPNSFRPLLHYSNTPPFLGFFKEEQSVCDLAQRTRVSTLDQISNLLKPAFGTRRRDQVQQGRRQQQHAEIEKYQGEIFVGDVQQKAAQPGA